MHAPGDSRAHRLAPRARGCLHIGIAAFAAFGGPLARAQEDASAAPIVVTASRVDQPAADALPALTVITREDIEATQSRDVVELLGRQVGLEFARSGGQGAQTSLFVRGTNSNQVLVLIDGVRMNSVLAGAANLGGIPTDMIERIEIVRGNLSSLYGSEAIGGVVQIFTRASTQPGAQALVEAGQGHTRDASATVTTAFAQGLLSMTAAYRSQDAISAINLAQVPYINSSDDGNWNRSGTLHLDQHGSWGELLAWAWGSRNDTDWDDPFNSFGTTPTEALALASLSTQVEHRSQYGFGASLAHRFGASKLSVSVSESDDNSVNVSNVPNNDANNDYPFSDNDNNQFYSRNRLVTLQDITTLAPGIDLTLGWEHLIQNGASNAYDPSGLDIVTTGFARMVNSFWAGTIGRWGTQQWQINVRNDQYSDFGSATTGLIGYGWSMTPSWKFTAQASTAFRAPSFNDLYYPISGNPSLQPEHAHSEEVGLRWNRGAASASVAVYRNRVSDLIEVGPPPTYQSINIGNASMDGSEWQAAGTIGAFRLGTSLSLDRPRDLDTGQPLLRRASYTVRLSGDFTKGPWNAGAEWQRTGARNDIEILAPFGITQLAPYDLARLTLAYRINAHVQLHLRVENVFNASYELIDGYNTLPRLIIAGIEGRI